MIFIIENLFNNYNLFVSLVKKSLKSTKNEYENNLLYLRHLHKKNAEKYQQEEINT